MINFYLKPHIRNTFDQYPKYYVSEHYFSYVRSAYWDADFVAAHKFCFSTAGGDTDSIPCSQDQVILKRKSGVWELIELEILPEILNINFFHLNKYERF